MPEAPSSCLAGGVLLLLLVAGTAGCLRGDDAVPGTPATSSTGPPDGPPRALLSLAPGDRFVYDVAAGDRSGSVVVDVGEPRLVLAADMRLRSAFPLQVSQTSGQAELDGGVFFLDLDGGLTLGPVDTCIVVDATCPDDDPTTLLLWQECPYGGLWSPLDQLPASMWVPGEHTLVEPVFQDRWHVDVRQDGPLRWVNVTVAGAPRPSCDASGSFTVDDELGVVTSIRRDGGSLRLADRERADGVPHAFDQGLQARTITDPLVAWDLPFAPGLGSLGPPLLPWSEAWSVAASDPDVATFLGRHEGSTALVEFFADSTTEEPVPGVPLPVERATWTMLLAGPGDGLRVNVTRERTPLGDTDTVASHREGVPGVGSGWRLPEEGLDAADVGSAARGLELLPDGLTEPPSIGAATESGTLSLHYVFPVRVLRTQFGGVEAGVMAEYLDVNALTGRLTSAVLDDDDARRLVGNDR